MEALLSVIGALSLVSILIVYSSFAWGFVLYKFWLWFLVPVFHLQPLHFMQAVGIMVVIGLLRNHDQYLKEELEDKSKKYVGLFLSPWMTLAAGALITLFI